ncbi:hypothetical protein IT400_00465 [Candidatus Nomurabacteria bacterium]|nr:hypothetical protein [Candidatus Nomurabacteria bacterium]
MIKTFSKIIIFIFIVSTLYIMRDDIISFINVKKVEIIKSEYDAKTKETVSSDGTLVDLKKVVDTPGALRSTSIFNLSKNGYLTDAGIISETNNERAKGNLTRLTENPKLNLSAQKKVEDMFAKQYFEHVSPSGVGVSDLGQQVGYEYIIIGENLALGNFKDDKAVLQAWMASPGHRANIMNANYTEIGVYAAKGMFEGKETWLAVQHFGTPQSLCPKIDTLLKSTIQADQIRLKSIQADLSRKLKNVNSNTIVDGKTHDEQVTEYNILVNKYNILVAKSKSNINTYNKQVRAFNACVEEKQ